MALYNNSNKDSAIAAVEFTRVPNGNFTFVYTDPKKKDEIKTLLTSKDVGQEIVAESQVNGKAVLITQGEKSQSDIMKLLQARGDDLQLSHKDKKFDPWKVRGALSMVGQPLQLISGIMQKGAPDGATITFAVSNMVANVTNYMFGAEKSKDTHRLRFLKNKINDDLDEHLLPNKDVFSVDDKRADLRKEPAQPQSMGQKFSDFMKKNSVTVGEIGLRYFGAFALAFPVSKEIKKLNPEIVKGLSEEVIKTGKTWRHWITGGKQLFTGQFKSAYETVKNNDPGTHWAGVAYLTGKTLAFTSKVRDRYNPEPPSMLDTIREEYVFKASSIIETIAAATLSIDRFKNRKITWPDKKFIFPAKLRGKETMDFLGGTGGALFTAGLLIRILAPFGVREVNMAELNAHITDTLAQTPPDKIPQLMADTASTVTEHFKHKKYNYGEIYTQMMTDLYRYHHIDSLNRNDGKPLADQTPTPAQEAPTLQNEAQPTQVERVILGRKTNELNSDISPERSGFSKRSSMAEQSSRSHADQEILRKAFDELHPPTNSVH